MMSDLIQFARQTASQLKISAAIIHKLCDLLKEAERQSQKTDIVNQSIDLLELPKRLINILKGNNILKIEDLIDCTLDQLIELRGFGGFSKIQLQERLARHSLHLKDNQ